MKPLLLTEEECDKLWTDSIDDACRNFIAKNEADVLEAVHMAKHINRALQSAAALGARKALEMVRDYHRKGGEIHETWLHKQLRKFEADGEEG